MNTGFIKKLENPNSKAIPVAIYAIAVIYCSALVLLGFIYIKAFIDALPHHWSSETLIVLVGIALAYALCVIISSTFFFHEGFLAILFFPLLPVVVADSLFQDRQVRKYLEKNKIEQNIHAPIVVIVTYPDRTDWIGWVKPNVTKDEAKAVVEYLTAKNRGFSFYLHPSFDDVESVMRDKEVKEVCFFGHGSSDLFRLSSKQDLFYCDFKDPKYAKELVHQIHCGDKEGKDHRLIDYVVPAKDRETCFWFDKTINESKIIKELKQRIERLKRGEKEI